MITSYSALPYFKEFSDETFIEATAGNLKNASPVDTIISSCHLGQTCKYLNQRIKNSWGLFIQYAGKASLLIDSFPKEINFVDPDIIKTSQLSQELLIKQFPSLKNWKNLNNLQVREKCREFHLPLFSRDLVELNYKLPPLIAPSKQWCAIYFTENLQDNIAIFDCTRENPNVVLTIPNIQKMQCDEDFLYVLHKESTNQSKLLRYNSKDWEKEPIELSLPKEVVHEFYSGDNELLFISSNANSQYQLSTIKKSNYLSKAKPSFAKGAFQADCPLVNYSNGTFFTLTPNINPDLSVLKQLHITDSAITKECLQILPINVREIVDFDVSQDKVFIIKKNGYPISCFNLSDGQQIKHLIGYIPEKKYSTYFQPKINVLPPHIKLTFHKIPYLNTLHTSLQTTTIDLDFNT